MNAMTEKDTDKLIEILNEAGEDTINKMNKVLQETEDSNYTDITESTDTSPAMPEFNEEAMKKMGLSDETIESMKDVEIDPEDIKKMENIQVERKDFQEAFNQYDLSIEDANKLYNLITRYKNGEQINYFNELPASLVNLANGLRATSDGIKVSKNQAAKMILDTFINDAKFTKAVEEYNTELSEVITNSNLDFKKLINESTEEVFSKIDEIREKDPEAAKNIEAIHNAFKDAESLIKQEEYINNLTSIKRINKFVLRFDDQCLYFNKKHKNGFGINIPDIAILVPSIKNILPGFTELQIRQFVVAVIMSVDRLTSDKLEDVAYLYRLVSNISICQYKELMDTESDDITLLKEKLTGLIQKIIML